MKAATESDVLRQCLDLLRLRGIYHWRQNQGPIPRADGKGYRRFVGLRGVADIIGILEWSCPADEKDAAPGRFLAVEVKKPGGRLRPEQAAFLAAVNDRGGAAVCVSDVKQLDDWLNELGV